MQTMPMDDSNNGDISDSTAPGLDQNAAALVRDLKVMTLATGSDQGCWSVPVYYVYHGCGFYFFSSPTSRHIRESEKPGSPCGASVFYDADSIKALRGVQMQGFVESVSMAGETLFAVQEYVRKFRIQVSGENILAAIQGRFRANFYRFVVGEAYYMDNRLGFGSRTRVHL